jgi:phage baseplate assembly protein W
MNSYEYIGRTVRYPLTVQNGSAVTIVGKEVIENSYIMILTTPLGSRYFLPEYGFPDDLVWEPNDDILARLLRSDIMIALNRWEKRSKVLDVKAIVGVDVILCLIRYKILGTNEFGVFPYPYYKNKAV